MQQRTHTIDATGKTLGRIASDAAMCLMGKRSPDYTPHIPPHDAVFVTNLSKARFTGTKTETKVYHHFSGYPGGLKSEKLGEYWEKKPEELFEKIVSGMLPKNKLRPLMLKKLKVTL